MPWPSCHLLIIESAACPTTHPRFKHSSDNVAESGAGFVWRLVLSYHLQDGGVAANDEGQTAEALDAMGDPYRQLLV